MPTATYNAQMALSSDLLGYVVIGRSRLGADGNIGKIGGEFADAGFADLDARLMGFETRRGRADDLAIVETGTTIIDLDDTDGALDTDNEDSPYYPNVKLMRRLRVTADFPDYETSVLADDPVLWLRLGERGSRAYSLAVLSDQPVAYWRLGEASATSALDASGNGRHGTYTGGVTLGQAGALSGDADTAALFDGSTGYVSVPDAAALNFGTGSFTLAGWIKTTTTAQTHFLNKNGQGTAAGWNMQVLPAGTLQARIADGATVTTVASPLAYNDGAWHFWAAVCDRAASLYRLYVDGVQVNTVSIAGFGSVSNADALRMGTTTTLATFFAGTLDEVAIYPTALSAARILAHYQAGATPDEAAELLTGARAVDQSGNGLHGTYIGNASSAAGALTGDTDAAALFDGTSGYVSVPDSAALDYPGSGGWSLEGWVKPAVVGAPGKEIVSKLGAAGQFGYDLFLDALGRANFRVSSDGTALSTITGGTVLSTAAFSHVIGVYTGTQLLLYVNGVSDATPVAYSSGIFSNTAAVNIGRNDSPGSYMNGTIDEVAIYPTALSAARILAHYQAGRLTGGDEKTFGLGYAFAEDYAAEPTAVGANVSVRGKDLFKRLANKRPPKSYDEARLGVRFNDLLNDLQWPPGSRAIDTGQVTVPAITLADPPLSHLDAPVRAERGLIFIAGSGSPTFHDRHHRLNARSKWTFGASAAGGLPIRRVYPAYSDAGIYNRVTVTRTGGVEQVAEDAASQDVHDVISYDLDQAAANLLASDGQALSWAQWLLAERKDPLARIRAIELDPYSDELMWIVLNAEISECITIAHDVPGTKGLTAAQFFIEGIAHTWRADSGTEPPHLCVWDLSKNVRPLSTHTYLQIGSGRIGERIAL